MFNDDKKNCMEDCFYVHLNSIISNHPVYSVPRHILLISNSSPICIYSETCDERPLQWDQPLMRDHICSNMAQHSIHSYLWWKTKDHLSYMTTFCGPMGWSHITGFTVYVYWAHYFHTCTPSSINYLLVNSFIISTPHKAFHMKAT